LLFYLISDSEPVCEPFVPRSSVAENEAVEFTCRMTYRWHSRARQSSSIPSIKVFFGWVKESETPSRRISLTEPAEQTVVQNVTVAGAKKPVILAQNCTIRFTFATPHDRTTRYSFADNSVSYTCSSDPIPVRRKSSPYHMLGGSPNLRTCCISHGSKYRKSGNFDHPWEQNP